MLAAISHRKPTNNEQAQYGIVSYKRSQHDKTKNNLNEKTNGLIYDKKKMITNMNLRT